MTLDAAQIVHNYSGLVRTVFDEATRGAGDGRRLHDELLAKYQVRPDGTTMWPSGPLAWFKNPVELTNGEAAMLNDLETRLGLKGLYRFNKIKEEAETAGTGAFGGKGVQDGHADAVRHAYWNAMMTQEYGEEWAKQFATGHERHPDNSPVTVAMDLHNNEVGRQIALANPLATHEQLEGLVEQAVRDGRMVVIDRDDMLVPSNSVSPGDTRVTDEAHPWPTNNPQRNDDTDPGTPTAKPGY